MLCNRSQRSIKVQENREFLGVILEDAEGENYLVTIRFLELGLQYLPGEVPGEVVVGAQLQFGLRGCHCGGYVRFLDFCCCCRRVSALSYVRYTTDHDAD